jgi:hypothetical protein
MTLGWSLFYGEGIFAKVPIALFWGVAKTINVLGFTIMYYSMVSR